MSSGSGPRSKVSGLRALQVLGAVVLVVAVLLGVSHVIGGSSTPAAAEEPATTGSSSTTTSPTPSVEPTTGSTTGSTTGTPERGGARSVPAPAGTAVPVARSKQPVRIQIPSIGVDSTLVDLGIDANGTIEVPSVPAKAGWLDSSPAPGQRGPAVIAGHVDSTSGPAVFYKLSDLRTGAAIVVTRRDGSKVRFTVDGVSAFPKKKFPTRATYGPVPGPALRLITCGGSYVKSQGGYLDNVVVFAT